MSRTIYSVTVKLSGGEKERDFKLTNYYSSKKKMLEAVECSIRVDTIQEIDLDGNPVYNKNAKEQLEAELKKGLNSEYYPMMILGAHLDDGTYLGISTDIKTLY